MGSDVVGGAVKRQGEEVLGEVWSDVVSRVWSGAMHRDDEQLEPGVVWCGVVWCGVVWHGVVWRGVAWCGVAWLQDGGCTCDLSVKWVYEYESDLKFQCFMNPCTCGNLK